MASLQADPSGNFHACYRVGEKRFKRSLHTQSEREANSLVGKIEDSIRLVQRGVLEIPDDADVHTFLLSAGKIAAPVKISESLTLRQLFERYLDAIPTGAIEDTTRYTIDIHRRHLERILGARTRVKSVNRDHLQQYVNARSKEDGRRGKKVSATTIRKEVTTLGGVWTWALPLELVNPLPKRGLKYPKTAEKPPFQTWEEIEAQIAKGGIDETEQEELWDCLFLTRREITQLLKHVKSAARQPFLHPMVVLAAHTGARRSELMRSLVRDFDDDTVTIRERKRSSGKHTTRRVPMSTLLRKTMAEWFKKHPGGQHTFCQHRVSRSKNHRETPQPLTKDETHDHLKRALAGSKWEKVRGWHVLRHSFISNCALKGIDQRIIDSFVGHTTDEMRRRYTHLFPSAKKGAIRSVFG